MRARAFALTAILTLAVGIGLSTAVFTVADALLIRRLPVADEDRVVVLWGETRDGSFSNFPLSLEELRDFERRSRSLERVAFFGYWGAGPLPFRDGDRVYHLQRALVSANYFDVLGARPVLGRGLRAQDDVAGAAPVVVLSHRAWQRHFGGDSAIVGRRVTMVESGQAHTIVGVMPQGLDYPAGTEAWGPLIGSSAGPNNLVLTSPSLNILARLRADASPAQARAELTSFFGRDGAPAWHKGVRGVALTLPSVVIGDTRPALLVVLLAAGLLLFIACVNVANLLLVRALARVNEFAVRSALGAGRARIVGQLLTEGALLSAAAGLLGVGLGVAGVRTFVAFAPDNIPRLDEIGVNGAALAGAVVITVVALLLSALGPALFSSRVDSFEVLRSGARQSGGRRARMATEILVVAQIALAVVSLSAAALMMRSLTKLQGVDLAFESRQLVVAGLALRQDQFDNPRKQIAMLDVLLPRLQALPGVNAVTPVLAVPFAGTGAGITGRLSVEGQTPEQAAGNPMLNMEVVYPNYFSTLRIPVLRGRPFSAEDREGAAAVVVVSSATANYYWPDGDPIGKRLKMQKSDFTVVGVVPDTRYRELRVARPSVYFPIRQSFFPVVPTTLLIQTIGSPSSIIGMLSDAVADAAPGVTLTSAEPFGALLAEPRAQPRLNALILAMFAAAAVSLAAIGLFAIIATMVRQRTRELGIRMALGATGGDVRRIVMRRGLAMATMGAALGTAGALASSRVVAALLYETSATDAATLAVVAALMLAVGAFASLIPAQSSARIDPVIALRSDA